MKKVIVFIIALGFTLIVQTYAARPISEETWRCGNSIVSRGDSMDAVLSKCGEPDSIDRKEKEYFVVPDASKQKQIQEEIQEETVVSEKITHVTETWKYNEGKNGFIKSLKFENDILTSITNDSRGSGEPRLFQEKNRDEAADSHNTDNI